MFFLKWDILLLCPDFPSNGWVFILLTIKWPSKYLSQQIAYFSMLLILENLHLSIRWPVLSNTKRYFQNLCFLGLTLVTYIEKRMRKRVKFCFVYFWLLSFTWFCLSQWALFRAEQGHIYMKLNEWTSRGSICIVSWQIEVKFVCILTWQKDYPLSSITHTHIDSNHHCASGAFSTV